MKHVSRNVVYDVLERAAAVGPASLQHILLGAD